MKQEIENKMSDNYKMLKISIKVKDYKDKQIKIS